LHHSTFVRAHIWLVLAALLSAVGGWLYVQRVLIAHQIGYAAVHGTPRGNLSDLYPRWIGAQELLLHGRDPYSAEVTREIQAGYYGRPLDPSRPEDPKDQQAFAYPVYVVFYLAPAIHLGFGVVQRAFFWMLIGVTLASIPLWLRALSWPVSPSVQAAMMALTLGSMPVLQGLKLQQLTLLVAAMCALAMALLVAGRPIAAGVLLALASIKPQLVLLLLGWLALWTLADWRRRYPLAVSFLATMTILAAASEWYLPHWIPRFWRAIHEYQHYTGASSVMDKFMGPPWSWTFELLAFAATMGVCWRERRQPANSGAVAFTFSLVLATTVLIIPSLANYNQVLLIPALLVVAKESQTIWRESVPNRALFVVTICLIFWPWIASVVLAGLSFVLAPETVERGWAIPLWTAIQIPVGVAALMLFHYHQKTFTASAGRSTS